MTAWMGGVWRRTGQGGPACAGNTPIGGGVMASGRTLLVAGMLLVLSAGQSIAGGPFAPLCTVPTHITLVGFQASAPDAAGMFTVVGRDPANNTLNGCSVVVELSGCMGLVV